MIDAHNLNLPAAAGQSIHQRRERLLVMERSPEAFNVREAYMGA